MAGRSFFSHARQQSPPVVHQRLDVVSEGRRPAAQLLGPEECLITAYDLRDRFAFGHVNQIYRLVREQGLPAIRFGRSYRFSWAAVNLWLSEREARRHGKR